ncbi:MAG: hypothetical protein JSV62_06005 [Promethearchaeota archaeon]|nr:MAG: hypothetical protein JSV62_06005 [Candidatus Lokiarchaeota archaeon]
MKKEFNKIILDGEEYTLSDDKTSIRGKDKTYKVDEFKKERIDKFPFSIIPPEKISEGIVYSFSNEQKFEKWLKENNLIGEYEKIKKIRKKAKKERSSEEIEKIKKQQMKEIKEATEKFQNFLKKHNLKSNEIEKIQELLEDEYDPELGTPGHTLYLFDQPWWAGRAIALPGNWFGGRQYRDLSLFDFNDITSSFSTWGSWHITLYCDKDLLGAFHWSWVAYADLAPFGFDNVASSCIVF